MKVSRFHYNDLMAAALYDRTGGMERRIKAMNLEIVDNPSPDEFMFDLSVMVMYPNVIDFPPLELN